MWQIIKNSLLATSLGRLLRQNVFRLVMPFSSFPKQQQQGGGLLRPTTNATFRFDQTRHFDDCLEKEGAQASCSSKLLTKDPCGKPKKKEKKEKPKEKAEPKKAWVLKSMWETPGCERKILCEVDPRYDALYYRISDKSKRQYQVTWIECPKILIKPKKVCLTEQIRKPKIKRRTRPYLQAAATACKMENPMECKKAVDSKCPRTTIPCCVGGRVPPSCRRIRYKTDCTKKKTPYPSFSECKKDPPFPVHPIECRCLDTPALCEAWAELRRRMALGMSAAFKCP